MSKPGCNIVSGTSKKVTCLLLLCHLEQQQQMELMEMIEDHHSKASTIIVSQLPVANWYDVIGEETIAIMDRLVHTSYKVEEW